MSCINAFAAPAAMATTQLVQTTCYDICLSWPMQAAVNRKRLSLSRVVASDESGK